MKANIILKKAQQFYISMVQDSVIAISNLIKQSDYIVTE